VRESTPVVVYIIADTHINAPNCDEKKLRRHVKLIQDHAETSNNVFWVHLGDWCDFISPNDKRFDIEQPAPSIITQARNAKEIFRPIAQYCIGGISGNHDYSIRKNYGDMVDDIAKSIGIPYLGDTAFIKLQMSAAVERRGARFSKDIFLTHGFGGGRKYGGKINKIQDFAQFVDADIYLCGHFHTYVPIENLAIGLSRNGTLKKRSRWFILASSYYEIYNGVDNYASRVVYQAQPTGMIKMEICGPDEIYVRLIK